MTDQRGQMTHSKVTLREQPAEPRLLLERNVRMYVGLVQRIVPRLSPMGPEELASQYVTMMKDERAVWEWLGAAHVLAICLRQIQDHLEQLRRLKHGGFHTPRIARATERFFRAYNTADLKNLRDLLEHQADYVAGKGDKRHLVVDLKESVSFGDDASGKVWVSIFGRQCRVDPIVQAVAALEVALRGPKGGTQ